MTTPFKLCLQCIFYTKDQSCSVFNKIPDEIWNGDHDHRKSFEGDDGITFELIEAN